MGKPERKVWTVNLSNELRIQVKVAAAKRGISIRQWVTEAFEEKLRNEPAAAA